MASSAVSITTAVVVDNKDPERLCRVRVRYPSDDPQKAYWARVATPMAGKDRGVVMIPDIGDEVLVAFDKGDLRFPFVIGALWSGAAPPPSSNDDGRNDERMIKSRRGHRLLFDDGVPGRVELAMDNGKSLVMDDNGVSLQDEKGNRFRIDSKSGAVEITATGRLVIKAATVSVEASGNLEIKAAATLTLRGALINLN